MNQNSRKLEAKKDGKPCYSIWLEPDFVKLTEALKELHPENRKLCIVTDSAVAKLYAEPVKKILEECCKKVSLYVFPAGEEHKTLDTVRSLYEHLDRKSVV